MNVLIDTMDILSPYHRKSNTEVRIVYSSSSIFPLRVINTVWSVYFHPKCFSDLEIFSDLSSFDQSIEVSWVSLVYFHLGVFLCPWSKFIKTVEYAAWYFIEGWTLVCTSFIQMFKFLFDFRWTWNSSSLSLLQKQSRSR